MPQPSVLYQLIEERLGEPLDQWVAPRKARQSWRDMAEELSQITGQPVSYESLRIWFADRIVTETRIA